MSLKTARSMFNPVLVDYISTKIDWTPTKKYTHKMCEFMLDCDSIVNGKTIDVVNYIDLLLNTFKLFDRYSKSLPKNDITQYVKFNDMVTEIQNYIGKFSSNKTRDMYKVEGKTYPGDFIGQFNDYKIFRINEFKEASCYSGYCGWCVTKQLNTYKEYTKNNNTFYFALKNGYEVVLPISNDKTPLDEYGLSMLAIRVHSDGTNDITTRWNHQQPNANVLSNQFGYLNNLFGTKDCRTLFVEKNQVDESNEFNKHLNVAMLRFKLGVDHQYIFNKISKMVNGYVKIKLLNRENVLNVKTGGIISEHWYDAIYNVYVIDDEVRAFVKQKNGYNIINENGKLVNDFWFNDYLIPENKDFFFIFIVDTQRHCNTMDYNGNLLNDEWFDYIVEHRTPISRVKKEGETKYLDKNGKIIEKK